MSNKYAMCRPSAWLPALEHSGIWAKNQPWQRGLLSLRTDLLSWQFLTLPVEQNPRPWLPSSQGFSPYQNQNWALLKGLRAAWIPTDQGFLTCILTPAGWFFFIAYTHACTHIDNMHQYLETLALPGSVKEMVDFVGFTIMPLGQHYGLTLTLDSTAQPGHLAAQSRYLNRWHW